jgi:type IV secretion system protein VirD4
MNDRAEQMARIVADIIVKNGTRNAEPDNLLKTMESSLLKALILYVGYSRNWGGTRTLCDVGDLLKGTPIEILDVIFDQWNIDEPCRHAYKIFSQAGKSRQTILLGLRCMLDGFRKSGQIPKVMQLDDTETMRLPKRKPCAYFIISGEDDFLPASSIFLSLLLCGLSTREKVGPIDTYVIVNELKRIGAVPELNKRIAIARYQGISISLILQSISELKDMYPHTWEEILCYCDTELVLGSNDMQTAEYMSERTGSRTTLHEDDSGVGSVIQCSANEFITLDSDELMIMINSSPLMRGKKYDYTEHPLFN